LVVRAGSGVLLAVLWGVRARAWPGPRPRRIYALWYDGGCVLAVSRTKWRVAGSEPGRSRRPVLFSLPVHGRAGRWRLEPRRLASTQESGHQENREQSSERHDKIRLGSPTRVQ